MEDEDTAFQILAIEEIFQRFAVKDAKVKLRKIYITNRFNISFTDVFDGKKYYFNTISPEDVESVFKDIVYNKGAAHTLFYLFRGEYEDQ